MKTFNKNMSIIIGDGYRDESSLLSIKVTCAPSLAAFKAQGYPAGPAPIIAIFFIKPHAPILKSV